MVVGISIMASTLITTHKLEAAIAGIAVFSFGVIIHQNEAASKSLLQSVNGAWEQIK